VRAGSLGRREQDALVGRGGRLAGHHVGAVAVEGDEEFDEAVAQRAPRVVAQPDVVVADVREDRGEPVHLGVERPGDHLALGLVDQVVEVTAGIAGEALHERAEVGRAGRVHEQRADAPHRVVAGGAGHGPVGGNVLVRLEDLLRHHPRPARGLGEAGVVPARIGQAVRVVDPEGVDVALVVEVEEQFVGGLEHLGVLHPDRREGADVEESAVVEFLVGHPPVGEAVVLPVDQFGDRERLRPGPDGEYVVEVAQHGLRLLAQAGDHHCVHREVACAQGGADACAQNGHQHALVGAPLDVEPCGVRRVGPLGQHRPQREVVPGGRGDGHVVGDHVHHHAEPARVRGRGEPLEGGAPAHHRADPGVVHHVIAVGGSRRGLEDRGEVDVSDAQRGQVVQARGGVVERQVRPELEAVGRDREPAPGAGQVAGTHALVRTPWTAGPAPPRCAPRASPSRPP